MRITQRSMQFGIESNLQAALSRVQRLQEQLSSGRSVSRPSDSPTSTVSALRYRAEIRRAEQLQRNADDAMGWLDTADKAIMGQISVVGRARELVLRGINGSMDTENRAAIAVEVEKLRESALAIANTTYLGRPVFGGTSTAQTAYDPATGAYLGDAGAVGRNIAPNVAVTANVTGTEAFGPSGDDLFVVLADIADHLTNDPSQLASDLTRLDESFRRLTETVAAVGARTNQVLETKDRMDGSILDATNGLAEVESIDLPATIVKLQMQEVAYQAALGATARMIQPSLVDFLR